VATGELGQQLGAYAAGFWDLQATGFSGSHIHGKISILAIPVTPFPQSIFSPEVEAGAHLVICSKRETVSRLGCHVNFSYLESV
jgi:hypothetical protein